MRGWTILAMQGTNAWETPVAGTSSAAHLSVPSSHVGSLELQYASSTDKKRVPWSELKSDFHEILIQAATGDGFAMGRSQDQLSGYSDARTLANQVGLFQVPIKTNDVFQCKNHGKRSFNFQFWVMDCLGRNRKWK
jgi:hypothetical protein